MFHRRHSSLAGTAVWKVSLSGATPVFDEFFHGVRSMKLCFVT